MKPSFKGAFYQVLGLEALSKSAAVAEPAAKAWFKAHQQLLWECAKLPPDSALESLRLGRVIPRQFEIETPLAMTNATAGTEIRSFDGKTAIPTLSVRGEINDVPADFWTIMKQAAPGGEIGMDISSPGGSSPAVVRMLREIKRLRLKVHSRITKAASAGAMLGCLASGRRTIAANGFVMLHSVSTVTNGDATTLRRQAKALDVINRHVIGWFVSRTGQTQKTVRGWFEDRKDHYFSPSEAMHLGLVDGVTPAAGERPAAACCTTGG